MKTVKPWIFGGVLIVLLSTCRNKEMSPIEQAKRVNEERFEAPQENDAHKLMEASSGNVYESMLADTAYDKASMEEVRSLAENLKKMHLQMNSELLVLASQKQITIPADITMAQKRDMNRISKRKGLDFDKDFVKHLRNKHEDQIDFYIELMEETKDPEIKQFARHSLTQVQMHMEMIEACWDKIKNRKPPKTGVDRGHLK